MKQKIKTILIMCAVSFFLLYLIGSFAHASFNIKEWTEAGRIIISILMSIFLFPIIDILIPTKNGN